MATPTGASSELAEVKTLSLYPASGSANPTAEGGGSAEPAWVEKGFLRVSELHNLYYEQSGRKDGNPVLFL